MNIKFNDLPQTVQNRIIWEIELDYDSYESSKAACIHDISNGQISYTNEEKINNYCLGLSIETVLTYATQERDDLAAQIKELNCFINNNL